MQQAGRDALIGAVELLVRAAAPTVLRDVLHRLIDGHPDDQAAGDEIIHASADSPAPDMTTPPARDAADGVAGDPLRATTPTRDVPRTAPPPQPARGTAPGLPAAKSTQPDRAASNGHKPATSGRSAAGEWMKLKKAVVAERQRRGMTAAQFAQEIGYSPHTASRAVGRSVPPSAPIQARLRNFLAGPRAPETSGRPAAAAKPPAATTGPGNGHAVAAPDATTGEARTGARSAPPVQPRVTPASWAPVRARLLQALDNDRDFDASQLARAANVRPPVLERLLEGALRPTETDFDRLAGWLERHGRPDPVAALSQSLRSKRRTVALTTRTIAEQAGVDVADLDSALAGQPVPPPAAERLSAWAAG